jgi:uncharacterized GH25 family protein
MKPKFMLVATGVAACSVINLQAHGVWFAPRSGELALIYGEGAVDDPIVESIARVKSLVAYDASGSPVVTKLIRTDRLLLVDTVQKPVVLAAVFDNGFWTTTADNQEVNKGKRDVPGAKASGHYMKYAVHLRGDLKKPLGALKGQTLQITPVNANLPKQIGDAVTLRTVFNGKPLAGAPVVADFINDLAAPPLRTDANGTVTVKVRNQGLNVIAVVHEGPTDNPTETDKVEHRATLSFVLGVTTN